MSQSWSNANLGWLELDLNRHSLFRRCLNCPTTPPPCPSCASDEVCSLIASSCNTCAVTMCSKVGAQPTSNASSGSGGAAAGPIAGGVVGGVALVCIVTYLVWRLCIKNRRQSYNPNDWPETEPMEKDEGDFSVQRDARASVHSVRSIASTVLTRASNVIQIAYIPGVTIRSESNLVPPVPPIPAASPGHSTATTPQPGQDQHFFMPSDLRDSTYSDYTVDPRISYARSSMTPSVARGSVASTAYRGSAAINSLPAQTAIRGKANPVAVKSGGNNSLSGTPRSNTPPVPLIDRRRYAPRDDAIQTNTSSPIVARLGVPKAVNVKKAQSHNNIAAAASIAREPSPISEMSDEKAGNSLIIPERQVSVVSSRHNGDSSTFDDVSSSDEESPADASLMGHDKLPHFAKAQSLSSKSRDSPFKSPSSAPDLRNSPSPMVSSLSSSSPDSEAQQATREQKKLHKRSGSLNQIIEEAARRASREPRHGGLGSLGSMTMMTNWNKEQREGPFSDAHAANTP